LIEEGLDQVSEQEEEEAAMEDPRNLPDYDFINEKLPLKYLKFLKLMKVGTSKRDCPICI
jgi:hypothetical protein